jgi:phosphoribosyl-dephospho-CoA transferase
MPYTSISEYISNRTGAFRPHDLIRVAQVSDLQSHGDLPVWARPCLMRAPFVVVRRAPAPTPDVIPVGIRGRTRGERAPAFLTVSAVLETITPEQLVQTEIHQMRDIPAFRTLRCVSTVLIEAGYSWGPTGSIAFELASGIHTATTESDLDLIIRAPVPLCDSAACNLFRFLSSFTVHVDVQLDTPVGVIALAEYVQRKMPVLARTTYGEFMVRDPWAMRF